LPFQHIGRRRADRISGKPHPDGKEFDSRDLARGLEQQNDEAKVPRGDGPSVHWWMLIPIAAAVLLALYGLFRWAAADPGIDTESAKERFRTEQDWRGLRRSGIDAILNRNR
jgi:hypothetical protein